MCRCHSVGCYNLLSGVKLSIRSFCSILTEYKLFFVDEVSSNALKRVRHGILCNIL